MAIHKYNKKRSVQNSSKLKIKGAIKLETFENYELITWSNLHCGS